ncbi:putative pectinesterase 53 [Sesamum angolense]|uniref:Pectinesterase n=1 Tax=Sesamum angolense TaxID=2727404 RepID=A0AAE1WE77_9LAMI|nr:putative pectinesterase 53 [Sesamum angolense]
MPSLQACFIALLVLLLNAGDATCHTKGIRPKRSGAWGKQLSVNMTQVQYSEQQFMKWVDFVGSLKHSLFRTAKNKLFPSYTLTVDRNPAYGDFTSIQDAIDSLPMVNLVRVVIKVHAGVYTEKNTTPVPPPGAVGKQAVAFRISADTAAFVGCKFLGAQDTLYDHLGRHYYKDCYIEGSVDFIFGNGLSLFENCQVHAIAPIIGAVTAQGRSSILDDTGFSFVNCKVTGSGALYLGRAWGPFSRVVFAYTYMDNIIIPKGWYNWGDPSREMTVFYGQYKCTGPGASFAGRVSWSRELTDEEAKPFISLTFIDGSEWIKI